MDICGVHLSAIVYNAAMNVLIHVLTCSSVLIWVVFNSFGCQSLLRLLWQNATDFMACCSVAQLCATLCNPMDCSMLGFPVLHCLLDLLKLMSIELVMPSHHLTVCCLLLLLPSIFLSIRVFFNESVLCTRWPKYWEFQLQHQSFQWIFRVNFL